MTIRAAGFLASWAAAASAGGSWTCGSLDGFSLSVNLTDPSVSYELSSVAPGGDSAVWLEGGSYALHTGNGSWATPGAGLTVAGATVSGSGSDELLGPFTYVAVPWLAGLTGVAFTANFTCYATSVAFSLSFPEGAPALATTPLPAQNSTPITSNARPSTHFPSFAAGPGTQLRSGGLGFAEWYGCMSDGAVGTALSGYRGGQESGPLLLFNRTFDAASAKPLALVLGPLAHFSQEILALVADPAPAPPPNASSCAAAQPDTDQTGAAHSPGYDKGTHTGAADACCALCLSLGAPSCDGWVFDTSGTTGSDCWPCVGISGSTPAANRTLGLIGAAQRLVAGVQGFAEELPPRFATQFVLASSSLGVTDAVYRFGALLRAAYRTQRMDKAADVMRNQISYWTDNGAYYEDDHWAKFFNASHTPQGILQQLKVEHAKLGVHFGTYQLDPWWSDGNGNIAPDWYWMANFTPFPPYFPDGGLAALGMPLTLYSNMYAAPPHQQMTQFDWVTARVCQIDGICPAHVVPSQSYDFHSAIFDLGVGWGMTSFEIDFLNFFFESFSDMLGDVRAWDEYWSGFNTAAAEHGVSIQLCMDVPAIALGSVQWGAVTNARLQGDGFPTDDNRYDIFLSSLLYGALELAPFLDNIWTTACQPGPDNAFDGACEPYVEALTVIAALSAGPVGLGDGLGWLNASLANMTCRADGVLLQPSLPATPLDAWFGGLLPVGSRLAFAPSFVPASSSVPMPTHLYPYPPTTAGPDAAWGLWGALLALNLPAPGATITLADTSPPLAGSAPSFLVTLLSPGSQRLAALCADGAVAANGCAAAWAAGVPLNVSTPADASGDPRAKPHEVVSVAPVLASGWALLGEMGKIARVSPTRFRWLAADAAACAPATPPSVCGAVAGAAGEEVTVTLVAPGGIVRVATGTVPASGALMSLSCSGAGAASACTMQ